MSSRSRKRQLLDGPWLLAAEESLLASVEGANVPATPQPGSEPPGELLQAAESAEPPSSIGRFRVATAIVPGCWEQGHLPKPFEGPAWFVRAFSADELLKCGGRVALIFQAVSYCATVWLNGRRVGDHRGVWDSFSFDVTDLLQEQNTLAVEVYKPWERYPVRESLAGFIPYVTTTFGGIWQSVYLESRSEIVMQDVFARAEPDRDGIPQFVVSGEVVSTNWSNSETTVVDITVRGERSFSARVNAVPDPADPLRERFSAVMTVSHLPQWTIESPQLITLHLLASRGDSWDELEVFTGLREVETNGRTIMLNKTPIYPRGVLHWLSYPELVAPHPDEQTIRHEIREMQQLGFSMIKLCLVVPPERYFEIADEMGMLLWLELPMWLPEVDQAYRERARREYRRILRAVRNHPSIVMYTLGCELSSEADAAFLRELYDMVKEETGSNLVRDNSGSAECYGGVDLEFADYHDYHFYAEAVEFTNLLDYFVPSWKPLKPLVFGEYCDSDTFRSVAAVKAERGNDLYWIHDDPVVNPQGVRWDYNVVTNESRVAELDLGISLDEITRRSYRKSFEYRKWIVEQTRIHAATSGYVITNIQDTPISTSGMLDDFGRHKFNAERFREFNASVVIAVERDRRRIWQRGADRTQHLDPHVFAAGEHFRVNAIVAHSGRALVQATFRWQLRMPDVPAEQQIIAEDAIAVSRLGTESRLVGNPSADLPTLSQPQRLELSTHLESNSDTISSNTHCFWILPDTNIAWDHVGLSDDRGLFASERGVERAVDPLDSSCQVLVGTAHGTSIRQALQKKKPMVLLLDATTSALTTELPFFREAIPLVHDHPVVDALPHDGYACAQWGGVTPDRALLPDELIREFGGTVTPIISRLDARTSTVTHYLCEIRTGGPPLIVTTLALAGSFGRTPQGLRYNVLGRYLLGKMIDYLIG